MWVATAAAVISAGVGVYSAVESGKAAEDAADAQAKQAEADAVASLVEQKRELIQSLASQNVTAASQGRQISSISTLQQEDMRRGEYDETMIKGGGAQAARNYRNAGSAAKSQSYLKAGTSLLGGVTAGVKGYNTYKAGLSGGDK